MTSKLHDTEGGRRAELWNMHGLKEREREGKKESNTGRGRKSIQFQTSQGMNEKTRVPGGETHESITERTLLIMIKRKIKEPMIKRKIKEPL